MKPTNLNPYECYCVSDNDEEILVISRCLEAAAEEAAESFYSNGDYPEEQTIHVERGDGEKRSFLVRTEISPSFYAEEIK